MLVWSLRAAEVPVGIVDIFLSRSIQLWLPRLRRPHLPGIEVVGVLGDSTVSEYPHGEKVPDRLQRALALRRPSDPRGRRRAPHFRAASLAAPGMGSLEYYVFADQIAAERPDLLVVALNLASLSPAARDFWGREELLGWLSPHRIVEASRLPLDWWGVTLDRLLLYMALAQSDAAGPWIAYRTEQIRAGHAIGKLRHWLEGEGSVTRDGMPAEPPLQDPVIAGRAGAAWMRRFYQVALDGAGPEQPVLRLLAAALQAFRERRIPVLVYVVPVNVEYLEKLGVDTRAGLAHTVATARAVVEQQGALFLDLHRLLADAFFVYPGDHFVHAGEFDGVARITDALADGIVRWRSRMPPRAPPGAR